MTEDAENIGGMTVNERLFHFALFTEFDEAVRSRKIEVVIDVLKKAQFSTEAAESTATAIFKNPEYYGY